MHPPEVREQVLKLVESGLNDCEISRQIAVPRTPAMRQAGKTHELGP
jgi:hypothetical protein